MELKFDASGTWRTDIMAKGQPFAYFGGSYTFSQEGVLRLQETKRSSQVCCQGQCEGNPFPDGGGDGQVYFQDADTIVTANARSEEQVYRRAAGGTGIPQVGGSGFPDMEQSVAPTVSGCFTGARKERQPDWRDQPALVMDSGFSGVWEAEQEINEDLAVTIGTSFGAGDKWRQDFTHEGNPVAFYERTFIVSPEGVLQLQVSNHSPELCLLDECKPTSEADIIRTFQVEFLVSDTFDMVGINAGGEEVRPRFWRSSRNGL